MNAGYLREMLAYMRLKREIEMRLYAPLANSTTSVLDAQAESELRHWILRANALSSALKRHASMGVEPDPERVRAAEEAWAQVAGHEAERGEQ